MNQAEEDSLREDKQPWKEKLPAFKTWEECCAYSKEKDDNFYIDAFMLEAWIGAIIAKTVEEYAENKSGNRHLQSGRGWGGVAVHLRPRQAG